MDNSATPESSVIVTSITDYLDSKSVEETIASSEADSLLADLGIVAKEDYSETLKISPDHLAKIGLKTVEDLKALGLGLQLINKLIINVEKLTDTFELQQQAFANKDALFSFLKALSEIIKGKLKESDNTPFYGLNENPWISLQNDLRVFKAELRAIDGKCQTPKILLKEFNPEACAAMAEKANALAMEVEVKDRKHQVAKLHAYVNQYGIYKLWTKLKQEGIENLSALLQQPEAPKDLFRMGE